MKSLQTCAIYIYQPLYRKNNALLVLKSSYGFNENIISLGNTFISKLYNSWLNRYCCLTFLKLINMKPSRVNIKSIEFSYILQIVFKVNASTQYSIPQTTEKQKQKAINYGRKKVLPYYIFIWIVHTSSWLLLISTQSD